MRADTKRSILVTDSIAAALEQIAKLGDSPESNALRARCEALQHVVERWRTSPPTPAEREAAMKLVLSLHVDVAKLGRKL